MDKRKEHWEIPRIPENTWLFEPNFDVSKEKELEEDEQFENLVSL